MDLIWWFLEINANLLLIPTIVASQVALWFGYKAGKREAADGLLYCAGCGYCLEGQEKPETCVECGKELTRSGAVREGKEVKVPARYRWVALVFLPVLLLMSLQSYYGAEVNKPTGWLLYRSVHGEYSWEREDAWGEVIARRNGKKLSVGEIEQLRTCAITLFKMNLAEDEKTFYLIDEKIKYWVDVLGDGYTDGDEVVRGNLFDLAVAQYKMIKTRGDRETYWSAVFEPMVSSKVSDEQAQMLLNFALSEMKNLEGVEATKWWGFVDQFVDRGLSESQWRKVWKMHVARKTRIVDGDGESYESMGYYSLVESELYAKYRIAGMAKEDLKELGQLLLKGAENLNTISQDWADLFLELVDEQLIEDKDWKNWFEVFVSSRLGIKQKSLARQELIRLHTVFLARDLSKADLGRYLNTVANEIRSENQVEHFDLFWVKVLDQVDRWYGKQKAVRDRVAMLRVKRSKIRDNKKRSERWRKVEALEKRIGDMVKQGLADVSDIEVDGVFDEVLALRVTKKLTDLLIELEKDNRLSEQRMGRYALGLLNQPATWRDQVWLGMKKWGINTPKYIWFREDVRKEMEELFDFKLTGYDLRLKEVRIGDALMLDDQKGQLLYRVRYEDSRMGYSIGEPKIVTWDGALEKIGVGEHEVKMRIGVEMKYEQGDEKKTLVFEEVVQSKLEVLGKREDVVKIIRDVDWLKKRMQKVKVVQIKTGNRGAISDINTGVRVLFDGQVEGMDGYFDVWVDFKNRQKKVHAGKMKIKRTWRGNGEEELIVTDLRIEESGDEFMFGLGRRKGERIDLILQGDLEMGLLRGTSDRVWGNQEIVIKDLVIEEGEAWRNGR